MKSPTLAAITVLALSSMACDKIPFLGKSAADSAAADTTAATPDTARDTTARAAGPAQPAAQRTPPPQGEAPAPVRPARMLVDEPWFPSDTGTVAPGITRLDVIGVWGMPVTERQAGHRTYMYYRNGCEVTCGTFDVVFLENDQVVDAIVRGRGHTYAGVSSSPPERQAEYTPPAAPGSGLMGEQE